MNRPGYPIDGRLYFGDADTRIELGPECCKAFMTQVAVALRPKTFTVECDPKDAHVLIRSVRIGVNEQLIWPAPAQLFDGKAQLAIEDIIPGLLVAIVIENLSKSTVFFRAWFGVEEIL